MSFIKAFLIASCMLLPTTCLSSFRLHKILLIPSHHSPSKKMLLRFVKALPQSSSYHPLHLEDILELHEQKSGAYSPRLYQLGNTKSSCSLIQYSCSDEELSQYYKHIHFRFYPAWILSSTKSSLSFEALLEKTSDFFDRPWISATIETLPLLLNGMMALKKRNSHILIIPSHVKGCKSANQICVFDRLTKQKISEFLVDINKET